MGSIVAGAPVAEEQMVRRCGRGEHPVTGERIGARYGAFQSVDERVADRADQLPSDLTGEDREQAMDEIVADERGVCCRRWPG